MSPNKLSYHSLGLNMLPQINNIAQSSWKNKLVVLVVLLLSLLIISSFLWDIYDTVEVVKLVHTDIPVKKTVNISPTALNKGPSNPADIFGSSQNEPTRVNKSLSLEGVILAKDNQHSEAIISSQHAESNLYKVGDAVAPGLKLEHVYNDRVVLNRSGILETLYIDWAAPTSLGSGDSSSSTDESLAIPIPMATAPNAVPEINNAEIIKAEIKNNPELKEVQERLKNLPQFKGKGFDFQNFLNRKGWGGRHGD